MNKYKAKPIECENAEEQQFILAELKEKQDPFNGIVQFYDEIGQTCLSAEEKLLSDKLAQKAQMMLDFDTEIENLQLRIGAINNAINS